MSQPVYTGVWVNYIRGPVTGITLTLRAREGAYLIAFLALFVRIAGTHLWNVTSFIVFQARSKDKPKDGLHYQHQAILRNVGKGVGAIWDFAESGWYWRSRAAHAPRRSSLFVLWGVLHITAFTIASIFSSWVTTVKSEVLVSPQTCGYWSETDSNSHPWVDATVVATQTHSDFQTASELVERCNNATGTLTNVDCLPYGAKILEWTTTYSDKCPFAAEMCATNVTAIFDSGFMDSRLDFGINSRANEASQYRRVWTCSPLETEGFVSEWMNDTQLASKDQIEHLGEPGEKWLAFYYGRSYAPSEATIVYGNESFGYMASSPWWSLPAQYLLE